MQVTTRIKNSLLIKSLFLVFALFFQVLFLAGAASAQWTINIDPKSPNVLAGNNVSYRIAVRRTGGQGTDIKAKLVLPANSEFLNASVPCDVSSLPDIECSLGNFSILQVKEFDVVFKISDAYVATTNGAGFFGFPVQVASVTVDSPPVTVSDLSDLHVSLFANKLNPRAGDIFTLSLIVDNFGPSAARKVETYTRLGNGGIGGSDDPVVNIQSCSFSVSQGCGSITQFSCTTGQTTLGQFGADVGTFATNVLRSITAEDSNCGDTGGNAPAGRLRGNFRIATTQDIDITGTVLAESNTPDANYLDNESTIIYDVTGVSDLAVTKTATGEVLKDGAQGIPYSLVSAAPFPEAPTFETSPLIVTQGRRIRYEIAVSNEGPSKAENVLVTDRLPPGVSVVPGSLKITDLNNAATSGSCQFGTPGDINDKMTCGLGTMRPVNNGSPEASSKKKITFDVVTALSLAESTILTNNVVVSADQFEDDNSNNLSTAFAVISPIKGISGCSAGGSYSNIQCADGSASIGLNGFGFAIPQAGALDFNWTTDCLNGVLSDSTVANPTLQFTSANPDNSPVSCMVNLSVKNSYAASSCSAQVTVVDCSADCNGKLDGTSTLDRCGICDGDGNSCLNCSESNTSEQLNKNLVANDKIRKFTLNTVRRVLTTSRKSAQITKAKKIRRLAQQLFETNNAAIVSVPNRIVSCTNNNFCVHASNTTALSQISTNVKSASSLLSDSVRLLRRVSGRRKAGTNFLTKANGFAEAAQLGLANIPLTSSSCS